LSATGSATITGSSFPTLFINSTASGSYKSGIKFQNSGTGKWEFGVDQGAAGNNNLYFYDLVANSERGRWDNSGNLLIGTTTGDPIGARVNGISLVPAGSSEFRGISNVLKVGINVSSGTNIAFFTDTGSAYTAAGSITSNGSTTAYGTSSDYRLKENVQPMSNGLATIDALKPVTYDWVLDKSAGEGFIAHELQAVIPSAVYGAKDAVNEDGSIQAQQVDYSKIVVHLVAAVQELSAELAALKAKVGA
jgi:hypothetical protein